MPSAVDISVEQTLELLDGPLASVAEGIAQDQYSFWLGSGISLGRMEGLKQLVIRLLDHLQRRQTLDADCRFRCALRAIIQLSRLGAPEQAAIDLDRPVASWPTLAALVERLSKALAEHKRKRRSLFHLAVPYAGHLCCLGRSQNSIANDATCRSRPSEGYWNCIRLRMREIATRPLRNL
jgi:hypothetical protein